jgi:hypothetical protein
MDHLIVDPTASPSMLSQARPMSHPWRPSGFRPSPFAALFS